MLVIYFIIIIIIIIIILAVLGLLLLVWAFSGCSKWVLLSGCGAQDSHCSGFSCCWAQAGGCSGFRSCGTWAQLLLSMWDLPRPGIKPMSPAPAGRFLTTEPPGKSNASYLNLTLYKRKQKIMPRRMLSFCKSMYLMKCPSGPLSPDLGDGLCLKT